LADIDLRAAINAVSDVVQNRPRPIRIFDQIYMKSGDMVMQSELVASWAKDKHLAFIGDGDAISVCVAYLQKRGILEYGPSKIVVYDFDERICSAVKRFADRERIGNLEARLYNCVDKFPDEGKFDCYYTNPPWGQYNNGESVCVFAQRGMEAIGNSGDGMVVIADDDDLSWPRAVLARIQKFAVDRGFYVQRMMTKVHEYHLDDAPGLRSCNLMFRSVKGNTPSTVSEPLDAVRMQNFYGRENNLRVKYVRERKTLEYGIAHDDEYELVLIEE